MKESFFLNGKEYIFLDWRIKPPGLKDHKGEVFCDPDALFGTENGKDIDIIGIHPNSKLIKEG